MTQELDVFCLTSTVFFVNLALACQSVLRQARALVAVKSGLQIFETVSKVELPPRGADP